MRYFVETTLQPTVDGEIRFDLPSLDRDYRVGTLEPGQTVSEIADLYARAYKRDGFAFNRQRFGLLP